MSTQGLGSLGAILPAYNAARFLDEVITRIQKLHPGLRILVVDDGSSDDSAAVARQAGAEVIVHSPNKGKGEALKTGYRWATEEGLDWVFTMDSDGQHLPEEMQGFLDVAAGGRVDAVVGSRMADVGDMPWIRLMTNRFTSRVVSSLAGQNIPDSQNGFRLYRVSFLEGLRLKTRRYDSESEILVRLSRRGARIGSAPITAVYGDEESSINPFVDTGRFFRLVFMLLFGGDS